MGTLYMQNIRSIKNKFPEIQTIPGIENSPDIMAFTETWLNAENEQFFQIQNYNAVFNSRDNRGGGLAMYIKQNINYKIKMNKIINNIEILTVYLENANTAITLVYKPPNVDFQTLETVIQNNIINRKHRHLVMGDFNINILKKDQTAKEYYRIFRERNYKILNKRTKEHHTRKNTNDNNSILDHIITNIQDKIKIKIVPNNISDHHGVRIKVNSVTKNREYKYYETIKTDYKKISEEIKKINRDELSTFEKLSRNLQNIIEKNTEVERVKRREECPWITKTVITEIRKRNNMYKKHLQYPQNETAKHKYQNQKVLVENLINTTRKKYYEKQFHKYNTQPAKTWNLINKELNKNNRHRKDITEIYGEDGTTMTDPKEIANEINHYFTNIGKKLAEEQMKSKNKLPITTKMKRKIPPLTLKQISTQEVTKIINSIKNNKAPGFDKITTTIIKENQEILSPIITTLINNVINDGEYPKYLKKTIIKPIHKKGSKQNIENYRPISLLSTLNKILEKCLHTQLTEHFTIHKVIHNNQYAFQKNSGTTSAAMDLINDIKHKLDNDNITVALYIDMKKAFDTVSKEKLLEKIQATGIHGKAYKIVETYLQNRPQTVIVNNTESDEQIAEYGIPQGGNLPPLLYILYTNDMLEIEFKGRMYGYADDTCIVYSNKHPEKIQEYITQDMKRLEEWCFNNLITINEDKTQYMVFSKRTHTPTFDIKIKNKKIKQITQTKYLGLTITDNLKWDKHIQNLTKKTSKAIAGIYKIKSIIPENMKKSIYHSMFTAHVNYLINIWSDTTKQNKNKVQRQQNKIIKLIFGLDKRTPTLSIYKNLQLPNIDKIIILKNLQVIHKIKKQLIKTNTILKINKEIHSYETRRITHIRPDKNKRKKCEQIPSKEAIDTYNKLPKYMKELNYLQFRKRITSQINK